MAADRTACLTLTTSADVWIGSSSALVVGISRLLLVVAILFHLLLEHRHATFNVQCRTYTDQ
jgi:hypothetical protein